MNTSKDMSARPLSRFREWINARPNLWNDIRLAGFALKTEFGWRARRILVSLNGPTFDPRVLRTERVLFFEFHMPQVALPRIILDVGRGTLSSRHLPGVGFDLPLYPRRQMSLRGYEHDAHDGLATAELDRLPRCELLLSGQWPERQGFSYEMQRQCDRELLSLGRGLVDDLAVSLGLADSRDQLSTALDDCVVRVVACVPARIASIRQTADRSKATVETDVRPDLIERTEIVMTPLQNGWRDPVRKPVEISRCPRSASSPLSRPAAIAVGLRILYGKRGADRTPCTTCPERELSPCSGFAPIVSRERAVQRVARSILAP